MAAPGLIQTQSRTANDNTRSFRFTIGDTNLVGGIWRTTITTCSPDVSCSTQEYPKPAS